MLDMSQITQATAQLLQTQLPGYIIERNPLAPPESWKVAVPA